MRCCSTADLVAQNKNSTVAILLYSADIQATATGNDHRAKKIKIINNVNCKL